MLLRHTTEEIQERSALTVNPAKTCQPIGAMYAALGIHNCLPHSHGSQGCCSYHRSTLTRHYKEPVMAATSSFTEGSSVFGGQSNLLQAIKNMFTIYNPDVVAVHTTCLSETIGDDIVQIIAKAKDDGHIPEGKYVIHANTPSYVGSHVTGFANMTKNMVEYFAADEQNESFTAVKGGNGNKKKKFNVIPGWVEPSDMREIKRLLDTMGLDYTMFPDTSDVLDAPMTGKHDFYPKGGVSIAELKTLGKHAATFALGPVASGPAAKLLNTKCNVPDVELPLPIGLRATDKFIQALHMHSGIKVPASIEDERGRLIDMIADMSQYLNGKRIALWGDPDQLVSLTEFLVDLNMKPVYIVTGTPGKKFEKRIDEALQGLVPGVQYKQGAGADMFLMHQWIKQEPVDLLIGNTYGKYISRDDNIPFVRHGFPILDRVGHSYFPTVGYLGGMRLIEKILSVLMDRQDQESPEESFELVM